MAEPELTEDTWQTEGKTSQDWPRRKGETLDELLKWEGHAEFANSLKA